MDGQLTRQSDASCFHSTQFRKLTSISPSEILVVGGTMGETFNLLAVARIFTAPPSPPPLRQLRPRQLRYRLQPWTLV